MLFRSNRIFTARWESLNLISDLNQENYKPKGQVLDFHKKPAKLLEDIHSERVNPFGDFRDL